MPFSSMPCAWLRSLWVTLVLLLVSAGVAPAQSFWVPSDGGNWFTPSNWDAGITNANSAWARFGRTGNGSPIVTVDGLPTVGRITFGPTISSSNFAHTLSGGGITLNNGIVASIVERTLTDGDSVIQT